MPRYLFSSVRTFFPPSPLTPQYVGVIPEEHYKPTPPPSAPADAMDLEEPPNPSPTPSSSRFSFEMRPLSPYRAHQEVVRVMAQGVVEDWDLVPRLWEHALTRIGLVPGERPLLLSEPSFAEKRQRERTLEAAFEGLDLPALFLAKESTLAAFAAGRSTALVLDVGATGTSAAIIHDGYLLKKSTLPPRPPPHPPRC